MLMSISVHFINPERNIPPVQRQMGIFRKSVSLSILNQFSEKHPKRPIDFNTYGMKHTVQEFLLHHDLLGVQIFHIMEKELFIVQMIKGKANNVCMRGQDN